MMRFLSFAAVVAMMSASLAARADTLMEYFTASGTAVKNSTGDSDVVTSSFAQFDPSLGTLNSITISLSGTATFTASGSDSEATFVGPSAANHSAEFLVLGAGNTLVSGTFAFSGNGTDSDAPDLPYLEGTGTEALDLQFYVNQGSLSVDTGTAGTLTYNYTPSAPVVAATPEPSSFALLGTGLVGVVGMARRRLA